MTPPMVDRFPTLGRLQSRGQRFDLAQRRGDDVREMGRVAVVDPPLESDPEDGDRDLGGQACRLSGTPRWRNASARAEASVASLISSRSRSSAWPTMMSGAAGRTPGAPPSMAAAASSRRPPLRSGRPKPARRRTARDQQLLEHRPRRRAPRACRRSGGRTCAPSVRPARRSRPPWCSRSRARRRARGRPARAGPGCPVPNVPMPRSYSVMTVADMAGRVMTVTDISHRPPPPDRTTWRYSHAHIRHRSVRLDRIGRRARTARRRPSRSSGWPARTRRPRPWPPPGPRSIGALSTISTSCAGAAASVGRRHPSRVQARASPSRGTSKARPTRTAGQSRHSATPWPGRIDRW